MGGFVSKAVSVAVGVAKGFSATKILGGLVLGIVAQKAISWLMPKPEVPSFDIPQSETAQGVLINKGSNNAQIPVVYGERKIGITRVFVETSGTDNQYLYVAGILCEGEIESIESIYIDDKLVTFDGALTHGTVREVGSGDSNFYKSSTSHIQVQAFLGLDDQVSSSILSTSTNWGANHRLRGVAYLALRFKWNQDIFGSIPDIKAIVKGKKVYDPRTTTTAYSDNSALCLLDYLRNSRYGKGLPDSAFEANFQSFQDSADECETQVTPYSGASDIDLFTTNAVLDTSQKLIDNVTKLLNPMRAIFSYNQGTYKLNIEGTGTATYTITSDNVIGGIKVIGETKNKKYNRVKGTFVNPDKNWQEDTVTFPPADDSSLPLADQHATMLSADNGTLLEGNFDFPFITNTYQAEELCEIILRRSRNALALEVKVTSEFLDVVVGDIVNVTYSTAGFSAKPFRVYSVNINADLTVDLTLTEHQDNFYTWTSKAQAPTIADTNLPNPNVVQPPASVTLSDQLIAYNDGTVIVALDIAIGASPDNFVDYYQVEYKKSSDTNYQIHGQGTGLNQRVLNVIDQETYDVRVKAVNALGASSTYVTATRTIVGAILPPADVEDFACNVINSDAHLSWSAVADLDLAYYQIRYSTLTSGAEWQNSVSLVNKIARPATSVTVPANTGSYLIKAVDKLGNFSSNESIISNTIITDLNAVATQTESPTFSGVKTNVYVDDNDALRLNSSELFDSATGLFDDGTDLFDSGLTASDLYSNGTYDFSNVVDLGAIYKSRVTASIAQTADNIDDLFDNRTGLFDDQKSNFDGDTPANCEAHLEIATSTNNVTYTAFRNFVVGDYNARYLKFRMVLISRDLSSTPVVSALSVTVDMPDRIFSGNDITSGTGTYSIVFTNPYYSSSYAVGITAQGLSTGDYYLLTNKTTSGFDIAFKDSSNTGISKTFDYITKGY
jgi:hypothetical protein